MDTEEKTNIIVKTTALVATIIGSYIEKGDFVVDCTMGNGHDTLLLARAVGADNTQPSGKIYAFDVQDAALAATKELLKENGITDLEKAGIRLIKDSHENLAGYLSDVPVSPSAIVFNLGFMPGQSKEVLTTYESSVAAVRSAIDLVKDDGIVSVVTYSGHREGAEENAALHEFLKTLPSKKYHVAYINMINQKKTAPALFLITRKKKKVKA